MTSRTGRELILMSFPGDSAKPSIANDCMKRYTDSQTWSPSWWSSGRLGLARKVCRIVVVPLPREHRLMHQDPENMLVMLHTWQTGDCSKQEPYNGDFEKSMKAIKARTLVLPGQTDLYFP